MKIRVVVPICHSTFNDEALHEFSQYASPGTEISIANITAGPRSIESEYEEAMSVPGILALAREAERDGYDAVISDCFGDPGVRAGRELVDIPVIGPAEASFLLAAGLGHRFSIVTVLPSVVPMIEHLVQAAGVMSKLASVRTIDIPVLGLTDIDAMKKSLYREMVAAIEEDDAHALVLGCTGMMGVAEELQSQLCSAGFDVPVVSPTAAAVRLAETLVTLGLRHSRITYMPPKSKDISLRAAAR
jgi:allantoin racemase